MAKILMMKNLVKTLTLFLLLSTLLGCGRILNTQIADTLPPCVGKYSAETWSNCYGSVSLLSENEFKGDKYIGEWENGKFNGRGTYYYLAENKSKGDKYVGEWKNGEMFGLGTYYFLANNEFKGNIYFGEHNNGKPNGQGAYTFGSQ